MLNELTKKRKLLLGGGAVAFAVGVALIGIAVVTLSGGGADRRTDTPLVELTRTPSPPPTGVVTEAPTATPQPLPPFGDDPYTMIIPKIGVNAPVRTYGLDENQVPEVPTGDGAADVVAWYNFSAKPGIGSNAVFAGHVTWFGAGVFYNLTSVAAGDEIRLLGQDGIELTYTVSDVFGVSASDPNSVQVMHATPTDTLTIITCDGTFTDTGDPVFGGEYDRRLVVRANLDHTTQSAAAAAAEGEAGG